MTLVRPFAPSPLAFGPADALRAQVVLRAFAAATNLLVPGRLFVLVRPSAARGIDEDGAARRLAGALGRLLTGFGARAEILDSRPETLERDSVLVLLDGSTAPMPGGITVLADPVGPVRVLGPDGVALTDPYDPDNGPDWTERRLEWARRFMPVTARGVGDLAASGLLAGRRIGLALVLEPKTAVLALLLAEAGARVAVFGHAEETREDVAAALRARGLEVFAEADADAAREEELARAFLATSPEFLLDDGSHLIRMAHDPERAPGALDALAGAAEETTSGIRPLRGFPLRVPVVASNDARSKTLFDNAYATGQSCLLTVLDLLDPARVGSPILEKRVTIVGYGDVGTGCARFAAACGALVTVVEIDPVRRLRARLDGYATAGLLEACANADLVMSATGEPATLPVEALDALPNGAAVAVAGGVAGEVGIVEALERGWTWEEGPTRAVGLLASPDGRTLRVLDRGACINCTAGEGNPIEIMDMSFGVQVEALRLLLAHSADLRPGLVPLPKDADDRVARRALGDQDD